MIATVTLTGAPSPPASGTPEQMPYRPAIAALAQRRSDELVITTNMVSAVWANVSERRDLDVNLGGCMGKASSFGLGLALAHPDRRVWVLDGDGSLLMNLGSLVTIAHQAPPNLVHIVMENGMYEVTGGQPVPGVGRYDFVTLAQGAGYPRAYGFTDLEAWQDSLDEVLAGDGPIFVVLHVTAAGKLTYERLYSFEESLRQLRDQLTQQD